MDAVKDTLFRKEAHLRLGGMHIDIHKLQRHLDVQHAGGESARHHLIAVGLLQCGGHGLGADMATIDEEQLAAAVAAGRGGQGYIAADGGLLPAAVHGDHFFGGLPSQHGIDGRGELTVTGGGKLLLIVLQEAEGDLGMGDGLPLHHTRHIGGFRHVGFHELQAGGRIIEEIAHHDGGALGAARGIAGSDHAAFQRQRRTLGAALRAGEQIDAGHGRDGRQCFAAEAQRADGRQILFPAQLAGGMAEEGGLRVLPIHTAAVIGDADHGHAAVPDLHGNAGRAGIDGIFHQLLHNGTGTFHDLARGDQIGNMGRKLKDLRHEFTS